MMIVVVTGKERDKDKDSIVCCSSIRVLMKFVTIEELLLLVGFSVIMIMI